MEEGKERLVQVEIEGYDARSSVNYTMVTPIRHVVAWR